MHNAIQNNNPFTNQVFTKLLASSKSVGEKTGWLEQHFHHNESVLNSYIKFHSYGEYIFDWAWANFYAQNKIDYYPKLIHAVPFTPVNAPKFLGNKEDRVTLANESFKFYQSYNLSSEHYLFINDEEEEVLHQLGFETLLTYQYHFQNNYNSFDDFLSKLKKNKRKNIKKERAAIAKSNIKIKHFTGDQLSQDLLSDFYLCYISTIAKKGSYPYLTKDFFTGLTALSEQTLLIAAYEEERVIAMSLFFYNEETLYGRNWGILPEYEDKYPFLHFELCYYQGIEFCISNNLSLFEAGAQGEHKLTRGFHPVIIKSAHHIKIPQCFDIIKGDILRQNQTTLQNIKYLNDYLPFKTNV